jgi:hypothetical protein
VCGRRVCVEDKRWTEGEPKTRTVRLRGECESKIKKDPPPRGGSKKERRTHISLFPQTVPHTHTHRKSTHTGRTHLRPQKYAREEWRRC